jgi:hypothetical protein
MLEDDYFARKRTELGMDRADTLGVVQKWLDERYPGKARAKSLHRDVLRLVTPNASLASELRMMQLELVRETGLGNVRVVITVASNN